MSSALNYFIVFINKCFTVRQLFISSQRLSHFTMINELVSTHYKRFHPIGSPYYYNSHINPLIKNMASYPYMKTQNDLLK